MVMIPIPVAMVLVVRWTNALRLVFEFGWDKQFTTGSVVLNVRMLNDVSICFVLIVGSVYYVILFVVLSM